MRCATSATQVGLAIPPIQVQHDLLALSTGILPNLKANVGEIALASEETQVHSIDASATPKVDVRPSPDRGVGLFAVHRIPAYSKVLEDDALLSLREGEDLPQLWEKYLLLPPELQQAFDKLNLPSQLATKEGTMISKLEQLGYDSSEARKMARINSRWQANAFKTEASTLGSPGSPRWAYSLSGTVARINHSCTPNACAHYRPSGSEVVYAIRDIEAGEEIEIAYFDPTMSKSDRQTRAKSWGFRCSCPACCEIGVTGTEYKRHLSTVHQSHEVNCSTSYSRTVIVAMRTAVVTAHSPEYPWLVVALPKLYLNLFNLEMNSKGRKEDAREALAKALEWQVKITGPNSPSSMQKRRTLIDFDAGD